MGFFLGPAGGNSWEDDPLEKSGKDSGETIEDFMEKDPLALPMENPGENPKEKFANPMEQNEFIEITLDDDTDAGKSKFLTNSKFHCALCPTSQTFLFFDVNNFF